MRVAAIIQFYLPYVLPRSSDWPGQNLGTNVGPLKIVVQPRSETEDLFPEAVDRTLSAMVFSIVRESQPSGGRLQTTVADRVMDRIRAEVSGDVASLEVLRAESTRTEFLNAAVDSVNYFLAHCRVLSRSDLVRGIERDYRLEDGRYYLRTPWSMTWLSVDDGQSIGVYGVEGAWVNGCCNPGAQRAPETGAVEWRNLIASLQAGPPQLDAALLIDAEERLRTLRLREAIIAMATACEIASDVYVARTGREHDPAVKTVLEEGRVPFAERRFDRLTTVCSGRSLREERPPAYKQLTALYRCRNRVAHAAQVSYRDDDTGQVIVVTQAVGAEFLVAAREAIQWLAEL